jgi:hypothetical protein
MLLSILLPTTSAYAIVSFDKSDVVCAGLAPKSLLANQELQVGFQNNLEIPLEICWRNYNGDVQALPGFPILQPGTTNQITTYVTHPFEFRKLDPTGRCKGVPIAGPASFRNSETILLSTLAQKCPFPVIQAYQKMDKGIENVISVAAGRAAGAAAAVAARAIPSQDPATIANARFGT